MSDTTNTGSAEQNMEWSTAWSAPGALVVREHTEVKRWSLAEPKPVDFDLSQIDEGNTQTHSLGNLFGSNGQHQA